MSRSAAFVLMADFNFLEISWKCHPAVVNRFERLLKFVGEKFLSQVCRESTRKDVLVCCLGMNKAWWEIAWSWSQ